MLYKLSFLFISLFLLGCEQAPFLPDQKEVVSDFVVRPVEEVDDFEGNKEFDFSVKNFPANCEWRDLVRVVDGDTVFVEKSTYVRFVGIDTPETKHPEKPVSAVGLLASAKTKEILDGSSRVCLVRSLVGDKIDKYYRELAYVFSEDGVDLSFELLRAGLARGYYYFDFDREGEFRFYEGLAKKDGVGVWEK